jgi:hypothetical protein
MCFQRNNKRWWALFLWGYEVSMVNSYVSMKRYCELKGVPVPWSHQDWNKAIGYAHLDPEYWPRRKGPFSKNDDATGSTTKRVATSDLPKKKAPRLNSKSLSPTRGRLKGWLDHKTRLPMPLPTLIVGHTRSQTQWTRRKGQTSSRLVHAHTSCNVRSGVHLCLKCLPIFLLGSKKGL